MRKINLTSAIAIAVIITSISVLQSCNKVADALRFDLKLHTGSVNIVIPASGVTAGTSTFGPTTVSYNVDSFIQAQTGTLLGVKNISSAKLASVTLTINDATPANNLANLQSVYAQFSSNTYPTPFVVSVPNIPDVYASSINIPVDTSAELKSYLGNQFIYSLTGQLRRATTQDMHCTVEYAFNIVVKG